MQEVRTERFPALRSLLRKGSNCFEPSSSEGLREARFPFWGWLQAKRGRSAASCFAFWPNCFERARQGDCARRAFPFCGGFKQNGVAPQPPVLRSAQTASSELGRGIARGARSLLGVASSRTGSLRGPLFCVLPELLRASSAGDCARRAFPFGGGFKQNGVATRPPVLRSARTASSELGSSGRTQNARFRGRSTWRRGGDSNPRYSLTRTAV